MAESMMLVLPGSLYFIFLDVNKNELKEGI
jgi:hypothetical protein